MPRSYVNNSMNRSLGRVGQPVGSMPVSSGSSGRSSLSSSSSSRSYVDNSMNRSLGRVGEPVGSMPVSSGSSGRSSSSSSRSYVDNSMNRSLGRVGEPVGSMPVSSGSSGRSSSSSSRSYVDNSMNRSLGRVGEPVGSMPVSSGSSGRSSSSSSRSYVDNAMNRSLGRVGQAVGSMPKAAEKTYVDNALNRKLERVGKPLGSQPHRRDSASSEKKPSTGSSGRAYAAKTKQQNTGKVYVDNPLNRRLGRVGKPIGTAPHPAKVSTAEVLQKADDTTLGRVGQPVGSMPKAAKKTYVDNALNRKLERVGKPLGCQPHYRVYVDNPFNRRLGRVGKPIGTAPHSAKVSTAEVLQKADDTTRRYKDNENNRKLGRVGLPLSSTPKGTQEKTDKSRGSDNVKRYKDNAFNRKLGRVGLPLGAKPSSKGTEKKGESTSRRSEVDYDELSIPNPISWSNLLEYEQVDEGSFRYSSEDGSNDQEKTDFNLQASLPENYKKKDQLLSAEKITLQDEIGTGKFSTVYQGKWQDCSVAVKKLFINKDADYALDKISELKEFDHGNIVDIYGGCKSKEKEIWVIMELMQMNLYDALYIETDADVDFSDTDRLDIIQQIINGLQYIHDEDLFHGELRSSKILINYKEDEILLVKITGFGMAAIKKKCKGDVNLNETENASTYAPEILRGDDLNTAAMQRADIYSLSMVMYEIIYEDLPFSELSYSQLKLKSSWKGLLPKLPSEPALEDALGSAMKQCWDPKPVNRPTISSMLSTVGMAENIFK